MDMEESCVTSLLDNTDVITPEGTGSLLLTNHCTIGAAVASNERTVVMIDARVIIRESLLDKLKQHSDNLSFLSFSSVNETIQHVTDIHINNSLFLLNIGSALLLESVLQSCVKSLQQVFPSVPIILLADSEGLLTMNHYFELNLSGFMTTNISYEELAAALNLVLAGGRYLPESLIQELHPAANNAHNQPLPFKNTDALDSNNLTPRQLDVLEMIYHGQSNKVIAYELGVCESTVKVHVRNIMKKLAVTNRTQVAYLVSRIFDAV